ncbi:hypothetical protein SERLA73DRAFT_51284 [Serpula lacrymans var. lacrymans S7.3]|uniref:Uncharacterized protein n=1 Tax=Serpula lacrymans var. lacrymans (strain S7.3) TaxID=936435 RepID=F8PST7_SERL3|nr:hypothetical protein SERLA73DRAFT_51284 [Serpula lacrymans var. lacrymans S7.3]
MCVNSFLAYISPFGNSEICLCCTEPHYNQVKLAQSRGSKKIPHQMFHTRPLDPQIQAL